jgi:hypothetical protein
MVSSRALEYVSRFSAGGGMKDALGRIVEYREECKKMYHDAETGRVRFNNYPAQKSYLDDMLKRIHALGEARDYVQTKIAHNADDEYRGNCHKNWAPKRTGKDINSEPEYDNPYDNPYDAEYAAEERKAHEIQRGFERGNQSRNKSYAALTKGAARKMAHLTRTEKSLKSKGFDEHEVKYIRRFQSKAIDGSEYGNPQAAYDAVDAYQDELVEMKDVCDSDDEDFYEVRIDALEAVKEYFYEMLCEVNSLDD